jgi:hypothetical protein
MARFIGSDCERPNFSPEWVVPLYRRFPPAGKYGKSFVVC